MTEFSQAAHRVSSPVPVQCRRYLALWFPHLAADRVKRERPVEAPLAIIHKAKNAIRIVGLDGAAQALGLFAGMTLADAQARVPDLLTVYADDAADAALLARMGDACLRFTPLVALSGTDGLLLDVTGCAHLFGGEKGLLKKLRGLMALGAVTMVAAIADTPDAASAFARHSRGGIVPPGQGEAYARRLAIAAVPAAAETHVALKRAGLKTIGDLLDRPSAMLSARFGEALARQVMRIAGREDTHITPMRAPPVAQAEQNFAEPLIHQDAIDTVLDGLIRVLMKRLELRGEGGRVFEAQFFRVDGRVDYVRTEASRPLRDAKILNRLFQERFAAQGQQREPGFGFDAVRLCALVTERISQTQVTLDPVSARQQAFAQGLAELIDALSMRYGRDSVQRFVAHDSHIPEREVSVAPAMAVPNEAGWPEVLADEPPLRPLQLFAPPQPVEVLAEVPDGPPIRFRWRHVLHQVIAAEGPERIAPEWWRGPTDDLARDYYRVEDEEGRRFWIFRRGLYEGAEAPRWFVHGVFA